MKSEYPKIGLLEVSDITTGNSNTIDATDEAPYPFFDRSRVIKRSDKYLFDGEAVIVPGEGQEFIPKYFKGKFDLHQRAYGVFPKENVDGKYLYYAIMHNKAYFAQIAVGSTVKSLRMDSFKIFKIPFPSIQKQEKIAKILSLFDDLIELNSRINDYLAQIVRTEYCNITSFAEGEKIPFSTIINIGSGGTPKTSTKEYWGGEIPFFSPKDVSGIYVFDTEKHISEKGLNNCNSALYPKDTIFITARGTVGRIAIAARDMAMNQSCYAIIGKEPSQQYYIHQTCLDLVDSIIQKSNGAVFDAINAKDLEQEYIIKLDKNVIERFELFAAPFYDLMHIIGKNISTLTRIRDYLLPKLISGDINVTDLDLSN